MKIRGGYTPTVEGRPSSVVEELALPWRLHISLQRGGNLYTPLVKDGQKVAFGDALAAADHDGSRLLLPAPAAGQVFVELGKHAKPERIQIETERVERLIGDQRVSEIAAMQPEQVRALLAEKGLWPLIWSSSTCGAPPLGQNAEKPKVVVVNTLAAEPFRARGKLVLAHQIDDFVAGVSLLPQMMADGGTIEIILTERSDPLARRIYDLLSDRAWVHFLSVPVHYPIENPRVIGRTLRDSDTQLKKGDIYWTIDAQGIAAMGACVSEGLPLYQRVVAVGGPGFPNPRHMRVHVGTPIEALLKDVEKIEDLCILRGGMLTGEPVDPRNYAVGYDDDAFFCMPSQPPREFLSFVHPGHDRNSLLPCYLANITGAADRQVSNYLRGERRPCIACGLCERVCPAGLLPQVLHRYLYRNALDEADAAGLDLCVDCNLCTYVCPSKIELRQQFAEAREAIRREHEEAAAAHK